MVPPTVGRYTPHCRRARLPAGICYEFSLIDLSRTRFRLLDLVDWPFYTGMSRRYTGVMVSLCEAIVFRFPPLRVRYGNFQRRWTIKMMTLESRVLLG